MEKEKLRKADLFSALLIMLFGLFVVVGALQMPMKDSWGGVQNVWYVSPALFPLFVGGMITLLGGILMRTAVKEVGAKAFGETLSAILGAPGAQFFKSMPVRRFVSMVVLFGTFVFMNIPRVDFYIASLLFILAFIFMFYLDSDDIFNKLLVFFLLGSAVQCLLLLIGIGEEGSDTRQFVGDGFAAVFMLGVIFYTRSLVAKTPSGADNGIRKRFKTGLIMGLLAPTLLCPVFKYFLLVPLPAEGIAVRVMDAVRYFEF